MTEPAVCSGCGNYEFGNVRTDREIICHVCVQSMLGYIILCHECEEYPFNALRAYLSDVNGETKGVVRVDAKKRTKKDAKSIEKCVYCGCTHWISECPLCGAGYV